MSKKQRKPYRKTYTVSPVTPREEYLKVIKEQVRTLFKAGNYDLERNIDMENFQDMLWEKDINLTWSEIRKLLS